MAKNIYEDGVVVARVRSRSNPRRTYKIRFVAGHGKRAFVCPCLSFRFAHGELGSATKRCRHMDEAGL